MSTMTRLRKRQNAINQEIIQRRSYKAGIIGRCLFRFRKHHENTIQVLSTYHIDYYQYWNSSNTGCPFWWVMYQSFRTIYSRTPVPSEGDHTHWLHMIPSPSDISVMIKKSFTDEYLDSFRDDQILSAVKQDIQDWLYQACLLGSHSIQIELSKNREAMRNDSVSKRAHTHLERKEQQYIRERRQLDGYVQHYEHRRDKDLAQRLYHDAVRSKPQ